MQPAPAPLTPPPSALAPQASDRVALALGTATDLALLAAVVVLAHLRILTSDTVVALLGLVAGARAVQGGGRTATGFAARGGAVAGLALGLVGGKAVA